MLTTPPTQNQLLFEKSHPGRRATLLPELDVPQKPLDSLLPRESLAPNPPPLPELSELDVVRHYANLAAKNMSVDTHFYPLGSCTMKYNPKRNERWAANPKLSGAHPYQDEKTLQGALAILFELQEMLAEISGLPGVSLQGAAGAHGELTALLVAAAYLQERDGRKRSTVLVPDGAHGTNPASAAFAGFKIVEVKSSAQGLIDRDDLAAKLNDDVAVLMLTNPNTLGLFETHIVEICESVHQVGGLVYNDGANMNAIAGITRPGDFGADMMHFNVHKTFSTPHGGGGPGAGPIAVSETLAPYLPAPRVVREGNNYRLDYAAPKSIGRVRSFFGSAGVLYRAYFYLKTLGAIGVREMAENAVLNANYLLSQVQDVLDVPYKEGCLHEFVASAKQLKTQRGISAMDIAKRLLDAGFHAPTVYFPLIIPEALMMEPTETESREMLDAFADALRTIVTEETDFLRAAPHMLPISRPDEVAAAKKPMLTAKK